jgi:hypothetical protein
MGRKSVISTLVEHSAHSTGVRSLSALCATERGRPALAGQPETG